MLEPKWNIILNDDPLLTFKKLRFEDVKDIIISVDNPSETALKKTPQVIRRFPLRFFLDGIGAYLYVFDNASINYVSLAVEMALTLKLRRKIFNEMKFNPKLKKEQINFYWLIEHSNLSQTNKKLAHNVRKMRNCYVHYQNIIAYADWNRKTNWAKSLRQQKKALKNSTDNLESLILNTEIDYLSNVVKQKAIIPVLEPSKEIKDFIRDQGEEFMRQFMPRFKAYESKITDKSNVMKYLTASVTGIEAFDALSCIKWSFKILKALKYC